MRGESYSGRSTNHSLHSATATIILWAGPADGLRSESQAPCVVCTQHINAPTAAAASHCFTCRSESDRMLLLLSSACVKTYTWMFIATGLPQAVRTGVLTPCPWLGVRARRRCRSSRRSAAVSSRTRKHCSRLDRRPSRQRRHALGLASLVCGMAVTRERQSDA
jgi:hypothetical protein